MGHIKEFLSGLSGAAGSGIVSTIGGLISGAVENRRAEQQHERNLELMEKQNEYRVQQWHRENEYNDPLAVAERFRNAGINPRAVLDGSASGAGIAGGLSSAPTGGAASPMPFTHLSGLSASMLSGARLAAQVKKDVAEANDAQSRSDKNEYEQNVILPTVASLNESLTNLNISKEKAQKIENTYKDSLLSLEVQMKTQSIDKISAEISKIYSDIKSNEAYQSLTEKEKEQIDQAIKESVERTKGYVLDRKLKEARAELAKSQSYLANEQALTELSKRNLMDKQSDTEESRKKNIDKAVELMASQISLIGSKIGLNKEQIKELRARTVKHYTDALTSGIHTLSEVIDDFTLGSMNELIQLFGFLF